MEFFIDKTYKENVWLGYHIKNEFVILDRKIKANDTGYNGYYFVKCSDWTIYKETEEWKEPNYTYIVQYLSNTDIKNLEEVKKKAIDKINEFLSLRDKLTFTVLDIIHQDHLKTRDLPPNSIVKTNRKFRESNCWLCKTAVDNSSDYECKICGWIICSNCGACKQNGCK